MEMKKRLIISLLVVAGALNSLSAAAQALPFTALDRDPAALAKGGTITGLSSTAYSSFGNIAAVPFANKSGDLAAGYTLWQPGAVKTSAINVGGAYKIKDRFGIAAGLSYGMSPGYDIVDGTGALKGTFKPLSMQFNAGFAWRFIENVALGVNVGYATSKLAEGHSYGAVYADVFAMARFSGFKAALGLADIGTKVKSSTGTSFSLPTAIKAGAGYEMSFGEKHGFSVDASVDYFLADGMAAAAGLEYTFDGMVAARAGYRYGGNTAIPSYASVGAGICFSGVKADLAYLIGNENTGNSLCISIGYTF